MVGSVLLITVAAFENLAATTILPVIARELDGFALYALAAGVPLATQVAAAALGGVIVDATGYAKPLGVGIVIGSAGLLVAGLAADMWVLSLGRGIAGFGIGLVIVALYAAIGLLIAPGKRASYFAAFSAAWVVPSMVGPAGAGLLAGAGMWRWTFLGAVPLFLVCLAVFLPLLRVTQAPDHAAPGAVRARFARIAPPAVILALALISLQAASSANDDGQMSSVALAVAGAVVTLATLPLLLPRGTASLRVGVPSAIATRLLLNGAILGTETFIPLFLQEGRGWSPEMSGLVLTVGSVTWALGAMVQTRARFADRQRAVVVAGALLLTLGVVLMTLLAFPGAIVALVPVVWALAGFGMGMTYPVLSVFVLENSPLGEQGSVSAALQIADAVGAALAIAIVGIVLTVTGGAFVEGFALMAVIGVLSVVAGTRVRKDTPAGSPASVNLQ